MNARRLFRSSRFSLLIALLAFSVLAPASHAASTASTNSSPLQFIDTSFENASPIWYDFATNGTVQVHLLYDHERSSPNRAAGHFHFQLHAPTGSKLTLEFRNLDNIWNSQRSPISRELKAAFISQNGRDWTSIPLETLETNRTRVTLTMPGPALYVARVEPYRLSDLDRFLASIHDHPRVQIFAIGKTVSGLPLEIIRIGNPSAPNRVFLRARAHPWEAGTSWIIEGLVARLLRDDANAAKYLDRYCVYILPMANKDGVVSGRTRFNLRGKDLNRDWDKPADPHLAPENHALEEWLEKQIAAGLKPHLALELHNDGNGKLHISRPPVPNLEQHLERMNRFEQLLREHTWFTEGSTSPAFRNSGTLGEGWLLRYGIDAAVHEFNCNWIAGLNDYPSAKHWMSYGESLAKVFHEYFEEGSR
ncbi:MAG: M14 family zinc carboxypeptidase [Limisphaerales bacterium]